MNQIILSLWLETASFVRVLAKSETIEEKEIYRQRRRIKPRTPMNREQVNTNEHGFAKPG
jgi:hypothetical protein